MAKRSGSRLGKLVKNIVVFIICLFVFAALVGGDDDTNSTSTSNKATSVPTAVLTTASTKVPTEQPNIIPTEEPTEAPMEIVLTYPELGEYGVYYTFNANVEKAEESDKETIIQCYVPAGTYTITNEGNIAAWTYVYIYSKETVISDFGWEEPADAWVSPQLKPGESCEITIKDGYYINLQQNDVFRLVEK